MQCPRCQTENPPQAKFCLECATPLLRHCVNCGIQLPVAAKFCPECARPVTAPATTQSRFTTPESYTPQHLAEKIRTSKTALEGERKQVTVLFADLKGSMELLADRDPEEARKLLDPVLERMMEAVHRYEGTVNQVMGDGIMALFGAPLAHEDHAVRACYAALRMQEAVKRYAEGVRRMTGVPVQIRVGLNSGDVVVRSIGSDLHMDYTAVGQTTHLAARMEQMAVAGTIVLTPGALALAEGYVQVTPLGPMTIKGLTEPVEVFELTGASAVRSRLQAAAARGLTRFVGRDPEMEQLRRALALAAEGHGQLVAVIGEPGVGKSRLVYEFTHSHRTQDWLIVEANSVFYGKATSYLPVIDLLKGYFKVTDRDTHREIREKVTGKLLTLDEGLRPILSPVLALLDVPVEDAQWTNLDPEQRRQRTLDAVKRLLLRETQVQPLLVVVEDLHWIDGETQAVLDGLVESLPAARLLLLVNYRPEYGHAWGSKTYYTQLRLDALPAETARELLEALLGRDASVEPLKPLLVACTGGNPLFLEESVRGLVETGALVGERGAYRLTHAVDRIQVPATVQAILAARIDRLPPEDKQLLQAAAVIGKDVPFVLLREIAEEPEERLRARLAHLQTAEFLYEMSLFPDLEYTFKHALTHEVAYASLLQERRCALHARIVKAIEQSQADRLAERVEQLSTHAARGQVWDKALPYSHQAALKAVERSAHREAVGFFDQALEALSHLPETRERQELAIDLRFALHLSLFVLMQFERMGEILDKARELAEALGERGRLAWVLSYQGAAAFPQGAYGTAEGLLRRGMALADGAAREATIAYATCYLGMCAYAIGDYPRAIELLQRVRLERGNDRLAVLRAAIATAWLAWALADIGEFAEASRVAAEELQRADQAHHPWAQAAISWAVGLVSISQGDFAVAVPVLERGLEIARSMQVLIHAPALAGNLGLAYAHVGRAAEALPLVQEAVRAWSTPAAQFAHAISLVTLGEVHLLAGHGNEALAAAREALAEAVERKERGNEAAARRLLGDIAGQTEPGVPACAEGHYHQALTLASELGMRPLVAHCHLGLGKLYRRTGKGQEAQEHLSTATTMYREMDMRFWLEPAEAALRELA
jgi:class 3 adenylate cyclase/tetratricopeptide (TPR) repeat protein